MAQQQPRQLLHDVLQIIGSLCLVLRTNRLSHRARADICATTLQRARHPPQRIGLNFSDGRLRQRCDPLFYPLVPLHQAVVGLRLQTRHLAGHLGH